MWVEALLAFIVEGYREFLEWLQTRPRRPRHSEKDESEPSSPPQTGDLRMALVDAVERILDRHARKHVGLVVGVWRNGEVLTFVRGRIHAGHQETPSALTIFGSAR